MVTKEKVKAAEQPVAEGEARRQIGAHGLSIWGGFVTEEYLAALKPWSREVRFYLEMQNDIVIGTLLDAIKMPLLAAEFSVEAASEDEVDQRAKTFLWDNMQMMKRQSWRSHAVDSLEMLDFGFAVGEMVLEKRDDGRLWMKNIDPRGQETLKRWEIDGDEATGFVQGRFRSSVNEEAVIPLSKCVHAVFRGRKGNPQGKSLLRSIFSTFQFKKNLELFEAIGIERDVGGMPVFELPENPISEDDFADLKATGKGIRVDEEGFIILPFGVTLSPYGSSSKQVNTRDVINAKQKDILMRFFAQFVALGMESVGTQALVEGSQDFFSIAMRGIQVELLETWQHQFVPFLFQYNSFPGMTDLPKIAWKAPGKVDYQSIIEAYTKGVTSRAITPIREDEEALREAMDLPELPEGAGDGPRDPVPTTAPLFGGFGEVNIQASNGNHAIQFAEPDLRAGSDRLGKLANDYQKELVGMYDVWAAETLRLMEGRAPTAITGMVDSRLGQLAADMKLLGRQRISEASGLGLGKSLGGRASSPGVLSSIAALIERNDELIDTSLVPGLREQFLRDAPEALRITDPPTRRGALQGLLAGPRARIASYSGGAVVAVFETQTAAGREENAARAEAGEPAIAVRWVLDPAAEHCADDSGRGTFGCEGLARVYPEGWDQMPTVPAGNVSCLGNCRCAIEFDMQDGQGWRRFD